jgi:hypothetical protein
MPACPHSESLARPTAPAGTYDKAKCHRPPRFKSLRLDIDIKLTHPDAEYKDLPEAAAA